MINDHISTFTLKFKDKEIEDKVIQLKLETYFYISKQFPWGIPAKQKRLCEDFEALGN
jgi:hypothetical protein